MNEYLKEILYLLGSSSKKIPFILVIFIFSAIVEIIGLGLIAPYISLLIDPNSSNDIFNSVVVFFGFYSKGNDLLFIAGILLIAIYLIKSIVLIVANYIIIKFSLNQQVSLRKKLMSAYQSLDYEDYLSRNSSEYVYSIQQKSGHFSTQVIMTLLKTISDGVIGLSILAFLAWTNFFAFSLLFILMITMIMIYDGIFKKRLRFYGKLANLSETLMIQGIQEGIEGFKEIEVLGCGNFFHKKVASNAQRYSDYQRIRQIISLSPRYLLELIMISFIILLTVIMMDSEDSTILLPTLGVFGFAAIRLLPSINILTSSLLQLRFARDSVSSLYKDLVSYESLKTNKNVMVLPDDEFQKIEILNVSFRYKRGGGYALKGINLVVKKGQSVGVIGSSGSGKSTILDVLLGLLHPQSGGVAINGILLTDGLRKMKDKVAYLPQEVFLIDDTLCNNIAFGVENIDYFLLEESIKQARLSELVSELPSGIDTLIGENGARLSGGQRQRIALARAFYHGREILIMDEATSSLDAETEREINDEILLYKEKKTMIIISHRMSTVVNCDYIYRIDKGVIIQHGIPSDVIDN